MLRNFSFPCMTIVGKVKISPHVEKFWEVLRNCWEILGNFATIYALSCGEKLSPKSTFVEKNDKYKVCKEHFVKISPFNISFVCSEILPFISFVWSEMDGPFSPSPAFTYFHPFSFREVL